MELREVILTLAGASIGFGLGLMVYVVHRIRETRTARYLRNVSKRYDKILSKADAQQARMQESVNKLTVLKEDYRVK